ncbi:MAG: acyltransferase family protein [Eubacterium sp.]|nr:acyltransferase family protein [Eubacterium sp.]
MKERNYGVDLLRIVAGFMIVFLHCFTLGGLVFNTRAGSAQEIVVFICSVMSIAGVNTFAVISGYVSCFDKEGKTKYSKYIELWLTVLFYSIAIGAIFSFILPYYSFMTNIKIMIFPVTSNLYWYFSAFTGLYIVKPFIDKGLRNSSVGLLKKLCIAIITGFSFVAVFADVFDLNIDVFSLYRGYSPLWIIFLYIIGYSVNKCEILKKYKTSILLIMLLITFMVAFIAAILLKHTYVEDSVGLTGSCLVYTFPTTVVTSILLLVIFSRIKVNDKCKKLVLGIAPTVFSIYLINCHPVLMDELITDRFKFLCEENPLSIVWTVFGFSIGFTIAAIIIDLIRIQIFKILHIRSFACKVETGMRKVVNKLANLI